MGVTVTVRAGECLSSIAFEHGHFWPTLWDHPDNAAVRADRKNPHVLREGDRVVVPDLRQKEVEVPTGKRHTFRRKGVPERLRIRFGTEDHPRKGVPFQLTIDGAVARGVTDDSGEIACYLTPNARAAELLLRPEGAPEERYTVALRGLDPVDTVTGLKQRLFNLGHYRGQVDSTLDAATIEAMRAFQDARGLARADAPDAATLDALVQAHGC